MMKKLLACLLTLAVSTAMVMLTFCVVLAVMWPMGSRAEEMPPQSEIARFLDRLEPRFLVEKGVFTEEEYRVLMAEKHALEVGRELTATVRTAVGQMPEEMGFSAEEIAALERTILLQLRIDELLITTQEQGRTLYFGIGNRNGETRIGSSLLGEPDVVSTSSLQQLLNRMNSAANDAGLTDAVAALTPLRVAVPSMLRYSGYDYSQFTEDTLDLSVMNAAFAELNDRKTEMMEMQQPANCDAAVSGWTLAVHPADIMDLLRAGIQTLIDNPSLSESVGNWIGFDSMYYAGVTSAPASFTDEFLRPLLQMLEQTDDDIPLEVQLTCYEDAAGAPVQMKLTFVDLSASEDAENIDVLYSRLTTDGDRKHCVQLASAAAPEQYIEFILETGEGHWYVRMAGVATEGVMVVLECELDYTVTRTNGVTTLKVEGSMSDASNLYALMEGDTGSRLSMTVLLDASGYSLDMAVNRSLDGRAMELRLTEEMAADGMNVRGVWNGVLRLDGEDALTVSADYATRESGAGIFDETAVDLDAMSEEELAGWLSGLMEHLREEGVLQGTEADPSMD